MLKTRHEEYSSFQNSLPFSFQADLERNALNASFETNWHENLEIELCTEGEGFVLLDGKSTEFKKGDFVVVNSNVVHYTSSAEHLKYSCLIIDSDFCKNMGIDHNSLNFKVHFQDDKLSLLFDFFKKHALSFEKRRVFYYT